MNDAARPSDASAAASGEAPAPWWRRVGRLLVPTASAAGGAVAVAVTATLLWGWRSAEQLLPGAFWRSWWLQVPDLLAAAGVALVVATAVAALARLMKRTAPWLLLCALVFAAVLLGTMGAGASLIGWVAIALVAIVASTTWGWCLGGLDGHTRGATTRRSAGGRTLLIGASLVAVVVVGYLVWPGPGSPAMAGPATSTSDDPGATGAYRVVATTYGSGDYQADAAYGPAVTTRTPSVDASKIIGGWKAQSVRSQVWGFSAAALPINARVWAPEGKGPFPLVLILHGNTAFNESETGFGYLARVLASQGYVVASIDENFLNTGLLDKSNPITGADAARAWLVLQHLHQWRLFDDDAASPFAGKVKLDDVTLIGHSRGGEAVAVAAGRSSELWKLSGGEVDADVRIRTVVALAPSDGQYDPKSPVTLDGVNYLTIGGTDDADVSTFAGARQYARANLDPGQVKAAVSMSGANHTQFNSVWGRHDVGLGAAKYVLNTAGLISPEDQRQATKKYVCAFLDLSIKRDEKRRSLFEGSAATSKATPRTTDVHQYADTTSASIEQFSGAGDAPQKGAVTVSVTGSSSRPAALPTRTGPSTNRVLPLSWDAGGVAPQYSIATADGKPFSAKSVLTADLAGAGTGSIPVRVTVTDSKGRSGSVGFGPHATTPPPATGSILKPPLPGGSVQEPALQTFRLPLMSVSEGGVDQKSITTLTITFGGDQGGSVYLDNVGVITPTPPR